MTKTDLIKSLTESQRHEFEKDVASSIRKIIETNNVFPERLHEVDVNMRLENNIFLNVTLEFIYYEGQIQGQVKDIIKFDNIDQYLDSINSARKNDDNKKIIL
jgi:hypothetical protein